MLTWCLPRAPYATWRVLTMPHVAQERRLSAEKEEARVKAATKDLQVREPHEWVHCGSLGVMHGLLKPGTVRAVLCTYLRVDLLRLV